MSLTAFLIGLAQGIALIVLSPGLIGLLRRLEARLQNRQGPPVLQPYRDLVKLLGKPAVRPAGSSIVFSLTPYVLFAVYGLLAFMIPAVSPHTLLDVDFILIIYLLGLARFVLSLAGLDGGGGFGGLGAGREMFLHFLTEIGLALMIVALAVRWNTTNVAAIFSEHAMLGFLRFLADPEFALLGLSMLVLVFFEAERIPIDNPATHLELTMSHRAITLAFAGRDLALIEWAEAIKLTLLLVITGGLFIPLPLSLNLTSSAPAAFPAALLGFAVRLGVLVLLVVLAETSNPKRRLRNIPRLALTAIALSAMAIIFLLTLGNPGGAIP